MDQAGSHCWNIPGQFQILKFQNASPNNTWEIQSLADNWKWVSRVILFKFTNFIEVVKILKIYLTSIVNDNFDSAGMECTRFGRIVYKLVPMIALRAWLQNLRGNKGKVKLKTSKSLAVLHWKLCVVFLTKLSSWLSRVFERPLQRKLSASDPVLKLAFWWRQVRGEVCSFQHTSLRQPIPFTVKYRSQFLDGVVLSQFLCTFLCLYYLILFCHMNKLIVNISYDYLMRQSP